MQASTAIRVIALALVALAAPIGADGAGASPPRLPGHALLVDRPGLRVFGPALHANVSCPDLLPLPAGAVVTVKRAVRLAMPPFERGVKLDGRDPIVKVGAALRSAFSYRAGGCGRAAWVRSLVASVLLPHVERFSASMSQHTFAVGRLRQGWVLWGYIH
jgi:hypothetical protein